MSFTPLFITMPAQPFCRSFLELFSGLGRNKIVDVGITNLSTVAEEDAGEETSNGRKQQGSNDVAGASEEEGSNNSGGWVAVGEMGKSSGHDGGVGRGKKGNNVEDGNGGDGGIVDAVGQWEARTTLEEEVGNGKQGKAVAKEEATTSEEWLAAWMQKAGDDDAG
ncbi:hypothetical protein B296_00008098 [Ensete ventricosum]|uniref:Uncharacterized protein n=1 Tax=Ensete ventricosum TaxID=4639 RepID=A0A427A3T0_ENSVE|nr:hypothetical protein B296_00008098 [Ensete ventricosum]